MGLHDKARYRDHTPREERRSRYYWHVDGTPDNKTVLVMEDCHHYWRVVTLFGGEAIMTGFDHSFVAERWAVSKGYRVLQQC